MDACIYDWLIPRPLIGQATDHPKQYMIYGRMQDLEPMKNTFVEISLYDEEHGDNVLLAWQTRNRTDMAGPNLGGVLKLM